MPAAEGRSQDGPFRRIVTGYDGEGRSTVVDDAAPAARIERAGGATVTEIWRADSLPAAPSDSAPLAAEDVVAPSHDGLAVRVCTFPPATAATAETELAYAAELERTYGEAPAGQRQSVPGMHRTDTVDVVTVISGELYMITESGETLLRAGDSVVQRGTPHAWSNRSDTTATVVAIMIGAAGEPPPRVGDR